MDWGLSMVGGIVLWYRRLCGVGWGNVNVKELQLQLRHSSLEQTDRYLRQMGVKDLARLRESFPAVWKNKKAR